MLKLLLPIVAVLAIGGSAAGASVYLLNRGETLEQVPPPAVQATSTPTPAPTVTPTPTSTLTPDPTATPASHDWVTYTDAELGFKLDYPGDWTQSEDFPGDSRRIVLRDAASTVTLSVTASPNPETLALEKWIETVPGWPAEPPDWKAATPEPVTLAGQRALRFSIDQTGAGNPTVYMLSGNVVYAIRANLSTKANAIDEATFQGILDTFSLPQ